MWNSSSVLDGVDTRVVQLVDVYVVGVQAPQALLAGIANELRGEVLGALAVSLPLDVGVEVVSELGAEDDLVPLLAQRLGDYPLAVALAVGVAGVEEVDAEVERLLEEPDAVRLLDLAPPARADRPDSKADLRDIEVGVAKPPVLHRARPAPPRRRASLL